MRSLPDKFLCFEISSSQKELCFAKALLERLTQETVIEVLSPEKPTVKLQIYLPSSINNRKLLNKLRTSFPKKYLAKIYPLFDWKTRWKKDLKPQKVSKRFWVTPSWKKAKARKGEFVIKIDPGLAFGTGFHPTTRFVLQMTDHFGGPARSFLDIGTGSGILAIAASRLKIPIIEAVDNDPQAVETARVNFKRNSAQGIRIRTCALRDVLKGHKFDFIAANLETRILLKSKQKLISLLNKKGHLAMSGIGRPSARQVLAFYKKSGLKLAASLIGREWCGFCFQRVGRN